MKKALFQFGMICAAVVSSGALSSCQVNLDDGVMRIGVVCIGDESATYDKNFMNALDAIKAEQSDVEVIYKKNVKEAGTASYDAAVKLAQKGCDIVISNSYGFEDNTIKAARKYPKTLFAHCTGDKAHTTQLDNYCNGFASIYEGRYLAGIAAGLKLNNDYPNDASKHKLGYVGAFSYAEVISGYTSFYLGAKSVCEDVQMTVTFTGSWGDIAMERNAAKALIDNGAKIVSQHADTYGAPGECDSRNPKIPNVAYNVSTETEYPNSYLCYSAVWWKPFFDQVIAWKRAGVKPEYDFTGTLASGAVKVGNAGTCAAPGTQEAMDQAKNELIAGTRKVFDCSKFTVEGDHLTEYVADVDNLGDYVPDTNVVKTSGGVTYIDESTFRSAPYFNIMAIDGISILGDPAF